MDVTPLLTLAEALPHAPFVERHARIIDAPPPTVWSALLDLRGTDLLISRPLVLIRSFGRVAVRPVPMVEHGPVAAVAVQPERRWVGVRIAQPWRRVPVRAPDPATLEDLADFDRPGWLKFGLEFVLDPVDGDRTAVTTTTRCTPTDGPTHRAFAPYWQLIRPFSGLIRRDLLAALDRACRSRTRAEDLRRIA